MNAIQEAKLNMYRSVQQFCEDNEGITSTNVAFATALTSFKANITSIISATSLESQIITGIAADKAVAKKNLCQSATDIGAIIFAYASANNNNTLKNSIAYSFTDLHRLKDDMLAPAVENIYNAANDNSAELSNYGITPAILATFRSTIDAYSNSVPKPKTAKATKSTQTANIKALVKSTDDILKNQMDKLVVTFKTTNPDFVSTYNNARVILDPQHIATQLKGTITDATTGQPIANATVQSGNGQSATTDAAGTYSFKPIPNGNNSITITKAGYQTQTIDNIKVKLGQSTIHDVALKN